MVFGETSSQPVMVVVTLYLGRRPSSLCGASSWRSNIFLMGVTWKLLVTGSRMGWLGLSGMVFRLSSSMIRGTGRCFFESGLVGFFSYLSIMEGELGTYVCGRGVPRFGTLDGRGLCLSGSWTCSMSCLWLYLGTPSCIGRMCYLGLIVPMVGTQ
jgi:hypothetical protein